jgi:hypothetical protein
MKAKNAEGLSVGRVLISGKNIRRKIRDLSAGPAINGLQPQVLDTVFFHSIHHSLPIRSEFRVVRYSRISIEKAAGRFSTLLTETHQRNLGPVVVQVRKVEGQQFAIARNRKPMVFRPWGTTEAAITSGVPPSIGSRSIGRGSLRFRKYTHLPSREQFTSPASLS